MPPDRISQHRDTETAAGSLRQREKSTTVHGVVQRIHRAAPLECAELRSTKAEVQDQILGYGEQTEAISGAGERNRALFSGGD